MAKAKNAHGGRRFRAGRKQSLSFEARMVIGSLCEEKWSAKSEAAARLEHRSGPYISDIREEQNRLNIIPVKSRSDKNSSPKCKSTELLSVPETIDEVSQEIEAILKDNGALRFSSTPVRRPQGAKEGLLEEVVDSMITRQAITKRMVKKCWDEFRSVQERLKLELA
jgi:hypothetical protein